MELPVDLYGQLVQEGEIYFFQKGCPMGIEEHRHVCVRHKGQVLVFGTCSSQTATAVRLAMLRKNDINTYPVLKPTDENAFSEYTYVDCNNVFVVSEKDFGEWQSKSLVRRYKGTLTEPEMEMLVKGVLLSTQVPEETKDLFRQ